MLGNWLTNKKKSSVINEAIKDFERITNDTDMTDLVNVINDFIILRSEKIKCDDKIHLNINDSDECNVRLEIILNKKIIGFVDNNGIINIDDCNTDYEKWKSNENRKQSSEIVKFRDISYFINGHGILVNMNRYDNQIFDFVTSGTFSNICDKNFIKDENNKIPVNFI